MIISGSHMSQNLSLTKPALWSETEKTLEIKYSVIFWSSFVFLKLHCGRKVQKNHTVCWNFNNYG